MKDDSLPDLQTQNRDLNAIIWILKELREELEKLEK